MRPARPGALFVEPGVFDCVPELIQEVYLKVDRLGGEVVVDEAHLARWVLVVGRRLVYLAA